MTDSSGCVDRGQVPTCESNKQSASTADDAITQQAATHKYESSLKAVLHILRSEGLGGESSFTHFAPSRLMAHKGLYAGLLPKLLQSVLTAAFMFVAQRRIYEAVKRVRDSHCLALNWT